MQNIANYESNKEKELLEQALLPTNDVIFHCLFGTVGNERITKDLLEKILNKEVAEIELDLNLNLVREHYDDKLGILDVRAKDKDGTNYNIEMQNSSSEELPERILVYWSRLYSGDLRRGNDYDNLNKTIAIIIVNKAVKRFKEIQKYETKWNIREEDYKDIILTENLEIRIIELPKYIRMRDNKEIKPNVWLEFLLNPERMEVLKLMEENEVVEEAREKWRKITADDIIRDRALRLEIAELDRNTAMKRAKEKGWREGKEEGMEQGTEQIIKNMLEQNYSVEEISKVTKVEIEKIKAIKEKLKKEEK